MSLLDKAKFWNHSHELSAKQEELWEKYVPASGNTEFVETEALRAVSSLYYDFYNNGWCNDKTPAIRYLRGYFFVDPIQLKNLDQCSRVYAILQDEEERMEDEDFHGEYERYDIFEDVDVIDALESIVEAVVKKLIVAEEHNLLTRADVDFWNY